MRLTLPLQFVSTMRTGIERVRTVRKTIHRHGKRHVVRRKVTVLKPPRP